MKRATNKSFIKIHSDGDDESSNLPKSLIQKVEGSKFTTPSNTHDFDRYTPHFLTNASNNFEDYWMKPLYVGDVSYGSYIYVYV